MSKGPLVKRGDKLCPPLIALGIVAERFDLKSGSFQGPLFTQGGRNCPGDTTAPV
jgi:hypothetical protein